MSAPVTPKRPLIPCEMLDTVLVRWPVEFAVLSKKETSWRRMAEKVATLSLAHSCSAVEVKQ